jgi:hypothetical protein
VAVFANHSQVPGFHGQGLAAWLWFLPPLGLAWLAHWTSSRDIGSLLFVWALIYAGMSRLMPRKQALHDVICRTVLIDTRP